MAHAKSVTEVYQSVVNDVIDGVREAFLDDGMDEQILQELKQLWETKLMQSKALEAEAKPPAFLNNPAAGHRQTQQQQLMKQQQQQNQLHQQQQQQQQQQQHHHQPTMQLTQQQLTQQQLQMNSLQGQILNIGGTHQQLSNSAQTAAQSLPPGMFQHMQNLAYLVPQQQGATRPFVIHQAGAFVQSQAGPMTNISNPTTSNSGQASQKQAVIQLDGVNDSSSEDEDEDGDGQDDDAEENDPTLQEEAEEEPLNSDDDDPSDTDPSEIFDADNVVVCQFDKINRSKAKWKFHLKDGIMNLCGKDYVFQKATGDAEF